MDEITAYPSFRSFFPGFVRAAPQFRGLSSCVLRPGSACRSLAFCVEADCSGPPSVRLTPLIVIRRDYTRARRFRSMAGVLKKLEATLTGDPRSGSGGFWRNYVRNLEKLGPSRPFDLPMHVYPAFESFPRDLAELRADFAIATYENMDARRDRERLLARFRLFETPGFVLSRAGVEKVLARCGRLPIRHIAAGRRDGREVLKIYAQGPLRSILAQLSRRSLAPISRACRGALEDLAACLEGRITAQVAMDFADGELVRLGVEIETPQFKALSPRDRAAVLAAKSVRAMPAGVRARIRSLLRRPDGRVRAAGDALVGVVAHMKVSFDVKGGIAWKSYFMLYPPIHGTR